MTGHRHFISFALSILAVCAVAVASQTPKQTAPAKKKNPTALSAQQVFKRVSPSVMVVESLDTKGKVNVLGSGVVIAPGRVITNRHVVEDGVTFRVVHNNKKWPAKLIKIDPDHDLAELLVAGLNAPAVTVLDSSKLAVGETVYAIGAPEGLELTISEGLISGLRDFDKSLVIQTSAAISPGSSGGGLFDAQGRLVGITTFYLKEGQSLNFALPAEWTVALNRQPEKASFATNSSSPAFQALLWLEVGYKADQAGDYLTAVHAFQETTRLLPKVAGGWALLGIAYSGLKQWGKAISAEQEAVRLDPDDESAWFLLGCAYDGFGQYNKAVSAYQDALRLKPDGEGTWINLGSAYDNLRLYEKAEKAWEQAIQLKPDDEMAWSNLGRVLLELGQYDKAVEILEALLRIEPGYEGSWNNLGVAYVGLGRYDKATEAESKAVRLNPADAVAWSNLGADYYHVGKYDKAIGAEKEAIRLNPDDALAWYSLGLAYKAGGQRSEVLKIYERLKALNPKLADKFFVAAVMP